MMVWGIMGESMGKSMVTLVGKSLRFRHAVYLETENDDFLAFNDLVHELSK